MQNWPEFCIFKFATIGGIFSSKVIKSFPAIR